MSMRWTVNLSLEKKGFIEKVIREDRFEKGASYHRSRSGHNVGLCTNDCGLSYKS